MLSEQGDILKVLIEHNRVDLVQKILEKSSDNSYKFHRVVSYGIQNALNIANSSGHTEIVKLLLAKDESGHYIHLGITDDVVVNVMLAIYAGRDSLLEESFLKAMLSLRVMASICMGRP